MSKSLKMKIAAGVIVGLGFVAAVIVLAWLTQRFANVVLDWYSIKHLGYRQALAITILGVIWAEVASRSDKR